MNCFEEFIKYNGITFKHAKGKSVMPGKEFHLFNEIIYFIDGKAEIITEKIHKKIAPKTLIVIPKETYHQLNIIGDAENYYRCLLNFDDSALQSSLKEISLFPADFEIDYLFNKLISNIKNPNRDQLLNSVLVLLLDKITNEKTYDTADNTLDPILENCIHYIDENIGNDLSIEKLSKIVGTSRSSLSHLFKSELNTPLHRYILKKRLIVAHQKLSTGESATNVSLECGFNDYSGFYKQYKNMFGFSPSKSKKGAQSN